ncbi:MAG: ThuA domain-containing protein [Verrucomicrobia bacterium]|nr:ThuA domain-containing protein [Verrucomicrobiota bacterium]
MNKIRVTIWNEFVHERTNPVVKNIYPEGIHGVIAKVLNQQDEFQARTATLEEPEHGLTAEICEKTDVLTWWGHAAHDEVSDAIVDRVQARVLQGMGLVVLHSGHYSKIFKRLMGTTCLLRWREAGERERVWVANPGHPIAEGLDRCIEIPNSEMYGEPFDIPAPEEQVFISWFEGGEVFRSGCCWRRGNGKIFYFGPGHELYPIYHHPLVQRVMGNAIRWARPQGVWLNPAAAAHAPIEQARERITSKGPQLHDATGSLQV